MAFTCIYAPSRECNGCGECEEALETDMDFDECAWDSKRVEAYERALDNERDSICE